jgi:Skp family chaperone for outer membrane proteins
MQIRTRRAGLSLGLALALLVPALPAFAEFKLAVVDQRRALLSSEGGKAAESTLSQLEDKKKKELEPRSGRCKKMQEDIEAQRFVLSDEAIQERMIEFQSCQRDLERDFQAAKDEIAVQNAAARAVGEEARGGGEGDRQDKGFDLVSTARRRAFVLDRLRRHHRARDQEAERELRTGSDMDKLPMGIGQFASCCRTAIRC